MADDTGNVYDPAALAQAMVRLSMIPDWQALQHLQAQYGHEDYQTPAPRGMYAGGTYVAANPLEHIASALQRGLGLIQQRRALGGIGESIQQQGQLRSPYALALERLLRPPEPQSPYQGEVPKLIE